MPHFFGRKASPKTEKPVSTVESSRHELSAGQVKKATHTRRNWALLSSIFLIITVVFLIVVEVGDTGTSGAKPKIWFIKLNLQNIVPTSVPNGALLNSIARTLGLHDFYTVGLWGFCEGYATSGVSDCSSPRADYWFNPVQIITNELLAGASIQLPTELTHILDLIKLVSRIMFAFFLTGACLSFILIFIKPLMVRSRWAAFIIGIFGFINAALIVIASVIATVLFIIMRNVIQKQNKVDIEASIGTTMFALMWVASAFALFAWIIDLCLMCCCASRRDVRKGKKRGSRRAYEVA